MVALVRRPNGAEPARPHLNPPVVISGYLLCQQGVVVVEDIAKLNRLLRIPDQEPAILLRSLEQLSQKLPSREILKSTKIGCFTSLRVG